MSPSELRAIRIRLKLTRAGLAEVLGITERAVASYEHGSRGVPGPVRVLMRYMNHHPRRIREITEAAGVWCFNRDDLYADRENAQSRGPLAAAKARKRRRSRARRGDE